MAYYQFVNHETGAKYGSFEVLYVDQGEIDDLEGFSRFDAPGWYWAAGFPGCLWDSDPSGPFDSEEAAYADAVDL